MAAGLAREEGRASATPSELMFQMVIVGHHNSVDRFLRKIRHTLADTFKSTTVAMLGLATPS
jgi:hypothetical protein